jgi:3-dehydroquinate dehydratase I
MNYPYCLPIIKSLQQEIIDDIRRHKSEYTYFEVWLDYIQECKPAFLRQLEKEYGGKLVVVFRRQALEPIRMPLRQRYELLDSLNGSKALVDLDAFSQKEEIAYIQHKRYQISTIISYHNYEKTPDQRELQNIVQQIRKNNPTISKIATYCQNEDDALRLLNLLANLKEHGERYIILGMGKAGVITRIFGSIWGNELIFAPEISENASAPGQLSRKQLDNILQIIGG